MDLTRVKVVKKDGTKEDFNVQKVISAISKSAERAMITFSKAELNFICEFVEEKVQELDQELIPIPQMHNIVAVSYTHLGCSCGICDCKV